LGLFGFDSGQEWYVSRQCSVGLHYKKDSQQLSGNNNFAFAA